MDIKEVTTRNIQEPLIHHYSIEISIFVKFGVQIFTTFCNLNLTFTIFYIREYQTFPKSVKHSVFYTIIDLVGILDDINSEDSY